VASITTTRPRTSTGSPTSCWRTRERPSWAGRCTTSCPTGTSSTSTTPPRPMSSASSRWPGGRPRSTSSRAASRPSAPTPPCSRATSSRPSGR
jgi:hypothetical protein